MTPQLMPSGSNKDPARRLDGSDEKAGNKFGLPPFSELLPLGYLYLLLLGIASESIHYGMLGVNLLDYSDLLDVLLSPIALVTGELAVLAVVLGVPVLLLPYLALMQKLARKQPTEKNARFRTRPLAEMWLPTCAAALFFAFLGLGVGQGFKHGQKLRAGELEADTLLTFADGRTLEASVIGINSGFVFYVDPGQTQVTIAPIAENLQSLRALD